MNVENITHPASDKPSTSDPALKAVGPTDNTKLPAAESAAPPPDVSNEVNANTPAGQVPNANGKKTPAPKKDKKEESSSKDKKKTGLEK